MNAKDINTTNIRIKLLLYGDSGSGKTTAACTFPKPYVFDFDNGMLSQRGKDVEFDTYKNYDEFLFKLAEFQANCPYKTLIIDSISTMQEYMMDKILRMHKRQMPTLNEWNEAISELKDLFMRLSTISQHLVVIAHQQLVQDELTSEVRYLPLISGKKLPSLLPLWFDEMYRTRTARDSNGQPTYYMQTRAGVNYTAKSRIHKIPVELDWSNRSLFDVINGGLK